VRAYARTPIFGFPLIFREVLSIGERKWTKGSKATTLLWNPWFSWAMPHAGTGGDSVIITSNKAIIITEIEKGEYGDQTEHVLL